MGSCCSSPVDNKPEEETMEMKISNQQEARDFYRKILSRTIPVGLKQGLYDRTASELWGDNPRGPDEFFTNNPDYEESFPEFVQHTAPWRKNPHLK